VQSHRRPLSAGHNQAVGVVRRADRPIQRRGAPWPPLQKLVNHETGATELAVWINDVGVGDEVRLHSHDCEEAIFVAAGKLGETPPHVHALPYLYVVVEPGTMRFGEHPWRPREGDVEYYDLTSGREKHDPRMRNEGTNTHREIVVELKTR